MLRLASALTSARLSEDEGADFCAFATAICPGLSARRVARSARSRCAGFAHLEPLRPSAAKAVGSVTSFMLSAAGAISTVKRDRGVTCLWRI